MLCFPGINWFFFSSLKNTHAVHFDLRHMTKARTNSQDLGVAQASQSLLKSPSPEEKESGKEKTLDRKGFKDTDFKVD